MPALVIPSIFTAVDQMSPAMQKMRGGVISFGQSAEAAMARTERVVRKLTPGLGALQKQMLSMVGTGAMVAGAFQLGKFSFNAITDYETAVDAFRVIVSDLNDAEFAPFQKKIDDVAKHTQKSSVFVAQAFEQIASKNAKFAETADGLGQVAEATITLAKAARMDLQPAAESLVGIMNEYSFGADQANRTINVLAAGQAVGAASIAQTAESFVNLGPTAASANVTLEQSVALIQTLAKFSLYGADAGTALRGSIIKLQKAGLGYKSGQFSINAALDDTNKLLDKLKTAKQKDALITAIFGIHNITAGKILVANRQTYNEFTKAVSGTSEAQKGAVINSGNMKTVLERLSAAWANMLTTSAPVGSVMDTISKAAVWLTNNLEKVLSGIATAVKLFLEYKAVMLTAKIVMTAWNVTLGISSVAQRAFSATLKGNEVALAARRISMLGAAMLGTATATEGATTATLGFNAAWAANPIGIIVLGVAALAAGIGYLAYHQGELNAEYERQQNMNIRAHIDAQTQATADLVKQWEKVGYATHDAMIKALQYQAQQTGQGVTEAQNKKSNIEGQLLTATDNAWFPAFNEDVSRLRGELEGSKSALSLALADKLGATNSVQQAIQSGGISAIEGRDILQGKKISTKKEEITAPTITQEKEFSPEQQAMVDEMNATMKASLNATITIKNDSNNSVAMQSGKSQTVNVMPNVSSTKVLTPAYGR
jgi:TP901 family phage tail tape measure protein